MVVQVSGAHDMVEHSGCPSIHWHEVHESVSHLSPSLRWTPSTVHPAGTERTVGGGGHCGQHCPSGVYWSSGPHHNSGHELHGLTFAVVSWRGNGRVAQLHVNDKCGLLANTVGQVCVQTDSETILTSTVCAGAACHAGEAGVALVGDLDVAALALREAVGAVQQGQ